MASIPPCKYDVFISFRGKDVRYGFLSHLSSALHQKQIHAFTDENLRKGEDISPALLKIIQESSVSIVIFSAYYADSPWCLDELVKILECKETLGQLVLPVFYQVDPTDVQELTGNFGKAFTLAKHGEQVKGRLNKVDEWKHALIEISNLSGWDSRNIKYESKLVEEIVNDVLKKFSHMSSSDDAYDHNFVGIDSRVKKVEWLLNDKRVIGIWGMGGIGKTTIAQQVFRRNMTKFDGHCFVDKVRETMTKQPPIVVRDNIICRLLRERNLYEDALNLDVFIRRRLHSKKIFIVFDDVDDPNHLKSLVGECDLYHEGSRIIITSRDWQVLKNFCSKECIYEVEKLSDSEDIELFSLHAFKQNHPKEGYVELSKEATTYAGGSPLALIVLGSHLFDLGIEEWKSELGKLKGESLRKIQDVLRISYNGLERNEKKIFLDIACFFKGEYKYHVERRLEGFGFFPKSAMPRLINKTLINIACGKVDMHDLLQQMGKDIVIEECKQPGGRSRLWNHEDIRHVLTTNTGTKNVEGILLDMCEKDNLELSSTAFMKMCNLRFLEVRNSWARERVLLPNNLKFLPKELRYLSWKNYPLKSLPLNFWPKNLVELYMHDSNLIELWNGDKPLENLKLMDLSYSEDLIRIPDLPSTAPNLEFLYLRICENLVEIPSSLQNLSKLVELDLRGCYNITDCPEIPCNIRILTLDSTGIEQLPSSIEHLSQLVKLSLKRCKRLVSIPSSIGGLKCLEALYLNGCSRLVGIPSSIGELKRLEKLYLYGCSRLMSIPSSIGKLKCLKEFPLYGCSELLSLPESIKQLSKLKCLDLRGCKRLKCLPDLPSYLKDLNASDCTSLESASTSFLFVEHADENKDEDYFADLKFLMLVGCVNLDKNDVVLYMAGCEVPQGMRYKNNSGSSLSFRLDLHRLIAFSFCTVFHTTDYIRLTCRVDFTDKSGHRHGIDFHYWTKLDYNYSTEQMLLWFNHNKFDSVDKECFVEASFHFSSPNCSLMKCGVDPIYR
ncbi:hypothetical protein P3X46_024494 [Hevea brasiliensis]|uniref:TIR domain-containing protein n=1 Tax=Hevea brasiliensis TaxID=3981 RepID=A0ABQ9L4E0_HEVBR|nr:hypothetical protein P3X46_024494 [Hevea brasiliensis]